MTFVFKVNSVEKQKDFWAHFQENSRLPWRNGWWKVGFFSMFFKDPLTEKQTKESLIILEDTYITVDWILLEVWAIKTVPAMVQKTMRNVILDIRRKKTHAVGIKWKIK